MRENTKPKMLKIRLQIIFIVSIVEAETVYFSWYNFARLRLLCRTAKREGCHNNIKQTKRRLKKRALRNKILKRKE